MIDTVLLDAGGVILDESEYERIRAEVAVETLSSIVSGYDLDSYWADVHYAVKCYVPRVYQYVLWQHCGESLETFERVRTEYDAAWKPREPALTLMAGIDRVLEDLAADFGVIIAGQYGSNLLNLLEEHDLLRFFLNALTQDDFGITKPDPRYYQQILERSGRSAGRSVMIGDRIDKDVVPAKIIGMRTVRIRTGIHAEQRPRIPDEVPDVEIASVAEIPDAVRSLTPA